MQNLIKKLLVGLNHVYFENFQNVTLTVIKYTCNAVISKYIVIIELLYSWTNAF